MFKLCLDSRLGRQQPWHLPDELVQPAEDDGLLGEEDERVSKKGFAHTRLSHALTWLLSDQIPGVYQPSFERSTDLFYTFPQFSFSVSSSLWLLSSSRPWGKSKGGMEIDYGSPPVCLSVSPFVWIKIYSSAPSVCLFVRVKTGSGSPSIRFFVCISSK